MLTLLLTLSLGSAQGATSTAMRVPDLAAPFAITAAGKPISVDVGHAAPFVFDWNQDGKRDLLVGQFGGGSLRIYLNQGTHERPVFNQPVMFQAGGKVASVPFG